MVSIIKLVTGKKLVLGITKSKQDEFFMYGFLYGGMFLLQQIPQHYFIQEIKSPRSEELYSSVD